MHLNEKARFWVGYLVAERWKAKFRGCLLITRELRPWSLLNALCHPTERYEQSSTTYECQTVLRFWFSSFFIDPTYTNGKGTERQIAAEKNVRKPCGVFSFFDSSSIAYADKGAQAEPSTHLGLIERPKKTCSVSHLWPVPSGSMDLDER